MSKGNEYFKNLEKIIKQAINTILIGRVISYDGDKHSVRVELLNRRKDIDGNILDYPMLLNVPCVMLNNGDFIIKAPYAAGDIVIVAFSQRDIDEILEFGKKVDPTRKRIHDIQDSICLGSINTFNNNVNTGNNLTIKSKTGTSKIVVEADTITIEANTININQLIP